jgi:hypothetical protein
VAALWKRTGREVVARFTGSSMEPTIPSGAEVRLRCGVEVGMGDVAAFLRDGHLIVHRVVGGSREAGWILTCGDALLLPDPPIRDFDTILGQVVEVRVGDRFEPLAAARRGLIVRSCLGLLRWSPSLGDAAVRALRYLRLARRRRPVEEILVS